MWPAASLNFVTPLQKLWAECPVATQSRVPCNPLAPFPIVRTRIPWIAQEVSQDLRDRYVVRFTVESSKMYEPASSIRRDDAPCMFASVPSPDGAFQTPVFIFGFKVW